MEYLEKDTKLKLRLMRHFWNLGYFVRKNIGVKEFGDDNEYTDIDVLAIKIHEDLSTSTIIGDCKTGQSPKPNERIFWLSGLMQHLDCDNAMLVKSDMNTMKYDDLAKKMNIELLSEKELSVLEISLHSESLPFVGAFDQNQASIENSFKTLKKFSKNIHDYVRRDYWLDDSMTQINNLIPCCKQLSNTSIIPDQVHQFISFFTYSQLIISLLRFSRELYSIPVDYHQDYVKFGLQGGKSKFQEKKITLESFYDFMVAEIRERYDKSYPLSKVEFLDSFLIRDSTKYIFELLTKILASPRIYSKIPVIFDFLAHNYILKDKIFDVKIILNDNFVQQDIMKKAFSEVMVFGERAKLLSESILKEQEDIEAKLFPDS